MKKTITLITALMLFILADAQASRLFLRIASPNGTANIAGARYSTHNGEFTIYNLPRGQHFITVNQRFQARRGQGSHRGKGRKTGHYKHRNSHIQTFRGSVHIPANSEVYARITPNGRLVIERVVPVRTQAQRRQPRRGGGADYRRNTRPQRSQFDIAKQTIRNTSFESSKQKIAMQYIRSNNISSREVAQIMRLFDFESTRLAFAKRAYNVVLDPHNYFVVNNAFQFESSIHQLDRYIRG